MRPITTLIAVALAVASGVGCSQAEPGKQPKPPVHRSGPPPVMWTLELQYPTKEACEAAELAEDAAQHEHGRCKEHKESPDR
jgi:hypothetical protein